MTDRSSGKSAATQFCAAPASAARQAVSQPETTRRIGHLIRTIEGEIIPRLLVSISGSLAAARDERRATAAELAEFVLASGEAAAAHDFDRLLAGLNRLEAILRQVESIDPGA